MSDQILIKKYSNRRLYDSVNKEYVTLEDIAELIKEGYEIKVIDSQTEEDITRVILIQVILESEKNNEDIIPASFLHMLIKYGNKVAKDFFENYFLMMFQPYQSMQESVKKNLRMWQGMGWFPPAFFGTMPPFGEFEQGELRPEDNEEMDGQENAPPNPFMQMQALKKRIKQLEDKIESETADADVDESGE